MNPLDFSFDKKVELLFATNSVPVGTGVNFIKFIEVDLDKVLQRTDSGKLNIVRSEGLDLEIVSRFEEHIKNGKYVFSYQQPVVCLPDGAGVSDELYELVCGEHRYVAHKASGRKKILVALVEFESEEDRIIFQSNENDPEDTYIKHSRTAEDVLLTLNGMVEKGIIDINDDKSINSRLIRLNQKTNDFPKFREDLRKLHGILSAVQSYDDKSRSEWCQQNKPEVVFSTRNKIVSVDGISYLSKTFKGGSGTGGVRDLDYDPRCFFDVCSILQSGNVDKVSVVASINDSTARKINQIREYKRNKMMQEWLDRCCSIVDDYRSGKINPVSDTIFNFVPQINNVDEMEDYA